MNKHAHDHQTQYWQVNNPKIDIWSLGIIILQFIYGIKTESFEHDISVKETSKNMINLLKRAKAVEGLDAYSYFIDLLKIDAKKQEFIEGRWQPLITLIKKCLKVNLRQRPTAEELKTFLSKEVNIESPKSTESHDRDQFKNRIFNKSLRSSLISMSKSSKKDTNQSLFTKDYYHLWMRGIDQVYYLWRMTGGDCMQILRQKNQFLFQLPSIIKTSKLFTVENSTEHGLPINYECAFDDALIAIPLDQLKDRLNSIKDELYFSPLEITDNDMVNNLLDTAKIQSIQKQPLNIRETDIEYQVGFSLIVYSRKKETQPSRFY
jgi:serine/threonine protein kinase